MRIGQGLPGLRQSTCFSASPDVAPTQLLERNKGRTRPFAIKEIIETVSDDRNRRRRLESTWVFWPLSVQPYLQLRRHEKISGAYRIKLQAGLYCQMP